MSNFGKGGRFLHKFTPYIILLPKDSEVEEKKCKYKACEKELGEEAKVMTNRKEYLNLKNKLPDRKTLSGSVLDTAIENLNTISKEKLENDNLKEIVESVVICSTFIPKLESMLEELTNLNIGIGAVVLDSVSSYAAARHKLWLNYTNIIFISCFAHQCNLAVDKIFKESSTYQMASREAIRIFSYFNNQNNIYFISKLRNIQKELYSKYVTILQPGDA
ncbi:hypothetical protein C1645_820795 [Glomus cerebriforme]|uniref:DUF659 domain-containing protein n=1 Tax=Glomus cerebriforme TaxID=658196 RepID=A0A397T3H3_9GLOM|nr:hypothetical protein C1645_820795 [Glomus cerebriforme]